MITTQTLKNICPLTRFELLDKYTNSLNALLPKYEVNTLLRIRHFIAQVAHESGHFQFTKEIASGEKYEFRKDLGNIYKGDGVKFKGRGLIQVTGRKNYSDCSMYLFNDLRLIDSPELLETSENCVKSALWYWSTRKLNLKADNDDIKGITKSINGGLNGIESRINLYNKCKEFIN